MNKEQTFQYPRVDRRNRTGMGEHMHHDVSCVSCMSMEWSVTPKHNTGPERENDGFGFYEGRR